MCVSFHGMGGAGRACLFPVGSGYFAGQWAGPFFIFLWPLRASPWPRPAQRPARRPLIPECCPGPPVTVASSSQGLALPVAVPSACPCAEFLALKMRHSRVHSLSISCVQSQERGRLLGQPPGAPLSCPSGAGGVCFNFFFFKSKMPGSHLGFN